MRLSVFHALSLGPPENPAPDKPAPDFQALDVTCGFAELLPNSWPNSLLNSDRRSVVSGISGGER